MGELILWALALCGVADWLGNRPRRIKLPHGEMEISRNGTVTMHYSREFIIEQCKQMRKLRDAARVTTEVIRA